MSVSVVAFFRGVTNLSLRRFTGLSLIALLVFTSSLPSFGQGRRTTPRVSGVKFGKKASTKRPARRPQEDRKAVSNDNIAAEKIISAPPVQRLTADIMIDQASRGSYKTVRQQL